MIGPTDYLRVVVDVRRLALLGQAALGAADPERVAEALGEPTRTILKELATLRSAGLIRADGTLDREALRRIGAALPPPAGPDPEIVDGPWTAEEVAVLSTFFEGGRLAQIPMQRSKRLVVLDRLAQEFEPGLRYSEQEVSRALQVFHDDYAALRRHLVDEGFMTRADGSYWRSGGRVEGG